MLSNVSGAGIDIFRGLHAKFSSCQPCEEEYRLKFSVLLRRMSTVFHLRTYIYSDYIILQLKVSSCSTRIAMIALGFLEQVGKGTWPAGKSIPFTLYQRCRNMWLHIDLASSIERPRSGVWGVRVGPLLRVHTHVHAH